MREQVLKVHDTTEGIDGGLTLPSVRIVLSMDMVKLSVCVFVTTMLWIVSSASSILFWAILGTMTKRLWTLISI
jgi:hypothetical protein